MIKTKLPNEFNYAEAYLTYRCDFGCSYCINGMNNKEREQEEMCGEEWIKGLNKLNMNDISITLGGGEPTKHKDFYKIINGIEHKIDLLTNLDFNVDEFIDKVSP